MISICGVGMNIFSFFFLKGADYKLLSYGVSSVIQLLLSEGERENDYNITIMVEVYDMHQTFSSILLPVIRVCHPSSLFMMIFMVLLFQIMSKIFWILS